MSVLQVTNFRGREENYVTLFAQMKLGGFSGELERCLI